MSIAVPVHTLHELGARGRIPQRTVAEDRRFEREKRAMGPYPGKEQSGIVYAEGGFSALS